MLDVALDLVEVVRPLGARDVPLDEGGESEEFGALGFGHAAASDGGYSVSTVNASCFS